MDREKEPTNEDTAIAEMKRDAESLYRHYRAIFGGDSSIPYYHLIQAGECLLRHRRGLSLREAHRFSRYSGTI